MAESVSAVVVTFNRKELLCESLDALLQQSFPLANIILIDNASSDGTEAMLRERGYLDQAIIRYTRFETNLGGAGGFYEGMRKAVEYGTDWIWVMDDDAEPYADALQRLISQPRNDQVVALACRKIGINGITQHGHCGSFDPMIGQVALTDEEYKSPRKIDYSSFVGLAMRTSAVKKVGLPRRDFFIWHDDVEYCQRLRSQGEILLVPDSVILHKDMPAKVRYRKFFFSTGSSEDLSTFWKKLCGFRNFIYLMRTHGNWTNQESRRYFFREAWHVLRFDGHKLFRLRWLARYYRQAGDPEFVTVLPSEWKTKIAKLGPSIYDLKSALHWHFKRIFREIDTKP